MRRQIHAPRRSADISAASSKKPWVPDCMAVSPWPGAQHHTQRMSISLSRTPEALHTAPVASKLATANPCDVNDGKNDSSIREWSFRPCECTTKPWPQPGIVSTQGGIQAESARTRMGVCVGTHTCLEWPSK